MGGPPRILSGYPRLPAARFPQAEVQDCAKPLAIGSSKAICSAKDPSARVRCGQHRIAREPHEGALQRLSQRSLGPANNQHNAAKHAPHGF